jgi:WD40 repeat protein
VAAWEFRGESAPAEPRLSATPAGHKPPVVYDLAVHPDGPEVVYQDRDGRLHAWKVRGENPPHPLKPASRVELRALHFDAAGKRLTYVTPRGTLAVLDWPGGAVRDTGLKAFQIALSPDGRHAATSNADHEILVYDLTAGREVLRLPSARSDVWSLAWSPGGHLAAGLSDGGLLLWDLEQVRARLREFGLPAP